MSKNQNSGDGAFKALVVLVLIALAAVLGAIFISQPAKAHATGANCKTFDRSSLTWDWNREVTLAFEGVALVKPAGAHNNIAVTGSPESIKITSNGGTQDRTGQSVLVGDYGSDIQSVTVCVAPVVVPPAEEPEPEPEEPPVVVPEATVEVFWAMPNGGTPDNVTWPQALADPTALECGIHYQVDTYTVSNAALMTADGILHYGEDHNGIALSWRFVYGGDCPLPVEEPEEPLVCPEGAVPGWLDENGNPTSCVSDNPTPEAPVEEPEAPVEPEVPAVVVPEVPAQLPVAANAPQEATSAPPADELAHTGPTDAGPLLLLGGGLLLLLGISLAGRARR